MYYVTVTANRKDAKRHIVLKCKNLNDAIEFARSSAASAYSLRTGHKFEIFTGSWQFVAKAVNNGEIRYNVEMGAI